MKSIFSGRADKAKQTGQKTEYIHSLAVCVCESVPVSSWFLYVLFRTLLHILNDAAAAAVAALLPFFVP